MSVKTWCSSSACKVEEIKYTSFSYNYCKECKCEVDDSVKALAEKKDGGHSVVNYEENYWLFDQTQYSGDY